MQIIMSNAKWDASDDKIIYVRLLLPDEDSIVEEFDYNGLKYIWKSWNRLVNQPWTIISTGHRKWAYEF